MSKITLLGIVLISALTFSESLLESLRTEFDSDNPIEAAYELGTSQEYQQYDGNCTVTTHGYIWVDGASIYFNLTVEGPCDSRIAEIVRDAIRELRSIK